jgi:hypothetical protein
MKSSNDICLNCSHKRKSHVKKTIYCKRSDWIEGHGWVHCICSEFDEGDEVK